MRIRDIHLPTVILGFFLTLALLIGGKYLWQHYGVDQPLAKMYYQTGVVKDFSLEENKDMVMINIKLDKTDNLADTYQMLSGITKKALGNKKFALVIQNEPNPELEHVYYSIHYDLQEAITTGNFSKMDREIAEKMRTLGITNYKVFVDSQNLYVQIHDQSSDFYKVLPRTSMVVWKDPMVGGRSQ